MTRPEGLINEHWVCHPDDLALPDCYTIWSHEMSATMYKRHAKLFGPSSDPTIANKSKRSNGTS